MKDNINYNDEENKPIIEFINRQKPSPQEIQKLIDENFWELF